MDLLHRHLCALLDTSGPDLTGQIDRLTGLDLRATWTPTAENFFNRVGAAYLLDLWCDLLGVAAAHPTATTFAKLKKKEKAEKLGRPLCQRRDPEGLRTDRGPMRPDRRMDPRGHGVSQRQGA